MRPKFLTHNGFFHSLKMALFISSVFVGTDLLAQGRREPRPIVLTAEDTAVFAEPPANFDGLREAIAHGKLDSVSYTSKTVGTTRKLLVYTPPGYSTAEKYPVLYLLHGIGGDEKEWNLYSKPNLILDNLIADKKAVPMLVVFPNGRAMKNDQAGGNAFEPEKVQAFANFEQDLLNDLIPFIETHYAVSTGSNNRALAGFSMGGGQSLNFGLGHPDTFACVGGFSSAPNTKKPEELVPDPAVIRQKIKVLYIACGNKDGLMDISQGLHRYLKKNNVTHIYQIQPGEHNIEPWKRDLYNFSSLLFR